MATIARVFTSTLRIEGQSPCVAELAQHVTFDPALAHRYDTSPACIAIDALKEHYQGHEMMECDADYYDGGYMAFKDGSTIRFS